MTSGTAGKSAVETMEPRTVQVLTVFLYVGTVFVPMPLSHGVPIDVYYNKTLEDRTLCSVFESREVKLDGSRRDGLIVSQTSSQYHPVQWNDDFRCEFKVKAKDGVFAVIQSLHFRRDARTGACVDYVQFRTRYGAYSARFCDVQAPEAAAPGAQPLDVVHGGVIDADGRITTTVFIDKEPLPPGATRHLMIVYTTYRECDGRFTERCIQGNSNYCYRSVFKQDGYVNCPFRDCGDEPTCDRVWFVDVPEHTSSSRVFINAGLSLLIPFLVFIVIIWLCKKTRILCFDDRCLNGPEAGRHSGAQAAHAPPARVIEMENRPAGGDTARPPATDEDKDLPPSYDSLFANTR